MGAGCYYTHSETRTRAFWVDLNTEWDDSLSDEENIMEHEVSCSDMNSIIQDVITELGYSTVYTNNPANGLFEIITESTYCGDGIVVKIEPVVQLYDDGGKYRPAYTLAMHKHQREMERIARAFIKAGCVLRIASSGYTSTAYNPDQH